MPKIESNPRLAACYIRVSTDEQADQSPESQLVEIQKYAARNGYILPEEYIFVDEGISGKKSSNRPAFQKMIGAAKEKPKPFDAILLWKFSRFARNQEESIVYKALLRKQCGVEVLSVSEQLPGGPFASLIERIIEWFDEFYSIRLAQEVKRSMTVKAQKGEFQATPSFGYRARIEPGKKTILEPHPEEAPVIREIFRRFIAGEGYSAIAKWLNAQGVKTHRGNAFENRTIEYIVRNPVYIGKLRWTPTGRTRRDFTNPDTLVVQGEHEPIIDDETYEAAQLRVAQVKAMWSHKSRPTFELKDWLGGAVRCSECSATLVFAKPHYFKCNNYVHGRCTSTQHIHVDKLHDAVLARLRQDIETTQPIHCALVPRSAQESSELTRTEVHLADLKRRQSKLLEAYLAEAIALDVYKDMNAALTSSIAEAESRLAELRAAAPTNTTSILRASIKAALETLEAPDTSRNDKNNAIRSITERIVFNKAQMTLDIHYRIIF